MVFLSAMAKSKATVNTKFKFHWEITDFFIYYQIHGKKLDSPTFKIKCSETTLWCVSLIPVKPDYISCSLTRMQTTDDLDDILVNYKMYIVDADGGSHFEKGNTKKLNHEIRTIEEPTFIVVKEVKVSQLVKGALNFRCEIMLTVDLDLATEWNFNSDLMSLSNDILRLYETKEVSDMILSIENTEFKVHKFVLSTRCPSMIVTSASSLALSQCSEENSNDASDDDIQESSSNSLIEEIERFMHPVPLPVYCLDCDVSTETLMVEGGSYENTFTIAVCEAILRYIYSGMLNVTESALKWRLYTVGLRHNLFDLINKLQDVEDECFALTEMILNKASALWDLSTYYDWSRYSCPTMIRLIHLVEHDSPCKRILCLKFTMMNTIEQGPKLYVLFKLIDTDYPTTAKLDIAIYHTSSSDCLRHIMIFNTFSNDTEWYCALASRPMPLTYGSVYFVCTVTLCNRQESRIIRQSFSLSDNDAAQGKSLRQFSTDFTKSYCRPPNSNYYDLTLIPDTCTVLAHKLIAYARSPVLREELLPKMLGKEMVTHKVPGTSLIVLRKVIEYMYKGMLLLKDFEHTEELHKSAEKFHIKGLVNSCNVLEEEQTDPIQNI